LHACLPSSDWFYRSNILESRQSCKLVQKNEERVHGEKTRKTREMPDRMLFMSYGSQSMPNRHGECYAVVFRLRSIQWTTMTELGLGDHKGD